VAVLVQATLHFQPRLAQLLAAVPGCEHLPTDPRFQTKDGRHEHRAEYEDVIRRAFRTRTSSEWLDALAEIGIPASRVQRIDDALAHPQLAYRNAVTEIDVPGLGPRVVLTSPFRYDGRRKTDSTPPPTLGEHTHEVLRSVLGYDDDRVGELARAGAFGEPKAG
jgi:succinate--hydroxymethylglutarate CoA-transferase